MGDQRVDERGALGLVPAGGKELLELVDRHDEPALPRGVGSDLLKCPHRMLTGTQERERPALAAGQHADAERGEEAGAQRRRLAAARRPHYAHQLSTGETRDHLGHQTLAAEEHVGVLQLEGHQALEGTDDSAYPVVLVLGGVGYGLQVDDVAGQVLLRGAQFRALGGSPTGCGEDPPGSLAASPIARKAMHAPRDPAARVGEPLDGRLHVVTRSRVQPSHGGNPTCVERRQREDRGRVQPSRKSCILRGHQCEQRIAANPPRSSASAGHSQSPARSASSITRSEGRRVARAVASTSRPASRVPTWEM